MTARLAHGLPRALFPARKHERRPIPGGHRARKALSALPILALGAALSPTPADAQPQSSGTERHASPDTAVEARIDELMAEYNRSDAPGAVIGVVLDGELAFSRAYGMASLEHGTRLTTHSIMDVGSVSKQMTAFAVVLLAQRGALDLDADIRTYLPDVPDFGSPITVRHLVHHTSGLREIYTASGLAGYQTGDGLAQEEALRLTTHMDELNFEPGTDYLYCNTGYMLLADIVGEVSGTPFPEFMAENVFGPLGMDDTTIMATRGQVIPGAAESYGPTDDGGFRRVFDNSGIQGAGGVYTTIGDLARWVDNYRTGKVGGAAAIEQMKQHGVLADGERLDYAFGINVEQTRGRERISHTGSSAGYRASMFYYPGIGAGVIRQSNRSDFDADIPEQVGELFFGDRLGPMPEDSEDGDDEGDDDDADEDTPTWTPTTSELRAFEGSFYSPELETVYTFSVDEGALTGTHRRHGDFELTPLEPDVFEGAGFFGTARFERDDSGRVRGLRVTNGRVRDLRFERMEG